MITLYHAPKTRASRFVWLLEELGAAYSLKDMSIRRFEPPQDGGDGRLVGERDATNPHPHGKVPAIEHDGVVVYESAAIALYLTDAFPDAGLGPVVGDPLRGPYLSWLAYYPGVFEAALTAAFFGFKAPASTVGWAPADEVMAHINATLSRGPYFLGTQFSAIDVLMGSSFALFMGSPLMPAEEPIAGYVARMKGRPAYQRAVAIQGEDS